MAVPWEKIFGVVAMTGENEATILKGCDLILKEMGFPGSGQ